MSERMSRRVVITGGTGFLGQSLARYLLAQGEQVSIIGRSCPDTGLAGNFVPWDGRSLGDWVQEVDGADALVNLAGRSVDCIKTPDHCDEIMRSRVESTRIIGEAVCSVPNPPRVWVQMSTAHIYGDPPTERCDESSAFGYGLAPDVGRAWEAAFAEAKPDDVRGVSLRTSFVVAKQGGAMDRLGLLAKLCLGGRVGSGHQGFSWIHERDMNRIFDRAISDPSMQGPYIATAPNPVSQARFMRALRKAMRVPIGLPAFGWMVRLGAPLILKTDPELALYGRYVLPTRLLDDGFTFDFETIDTAFADLFGELVSST